MPNHHVLQRPLNKVFPLEIRSFEQEVDNTAEPDIANFDQVDNTVEPDSTHVGNEETSDVNTGTSNSTSNKATRRNMPRSSKTRAYEVIQNFERELDSPVTQINMSKWIMLPIMMCLINAVSAQSRVNIMCKNGTVILQPQKTQFEVCFNNECKEFINSTHIVKLKIPVSPLEKSVNVSVVFPQFNLSETVTCAPPSFCDGSTQIMTRALLGNPHCWPTGAIITLAIIAYIILTVMMVCVSVTVKRITRRAKKSTADSHEDYLLDTFNPKPLGLSTTVTIAVLLLATITNVDSCQHGFMRHTVDLVCDNHGKCTYEYNQEVLFNHIHSELCIYARHGNKTVGTIKIRRKSLRLMCAKISNFFTRDSTHKIFHATRCSEAGSCTENRCNTLKPNETVRELAEAAIYPGYSACENTCGGLVCGCFLPMPACTFIRLAHIPKSETVFEVINCLDWKPFVQLEVEFLYKNVERKFDVNLIPYISQDHDELSLNVISLQEPHSALMSRRFATSKSETLMIPHNYELPVECSSEAMASLDFKNCENKMVCVCKNFKAPQLCHCPENSIEDIRADAGNRLPIITPSMEIHAENDRIYALSRKSEMTLSIRSNILIESADLIIDQPCAPQLSTIRGCYSCQEGAELNATCTSKLESIITIYCDDHVFTIECGPENKTSTILLEFNNSVIAQKCHAKCEGEEIMLELRGSLLYHPRTRSEITFVNQSSWTASWSTLTDFHLPDMEPIIKMVKHHWKTTLAAVGTVTVLLGLTYACGPAIIIFAAQAAIFFGKFVLKATWNFLQLCRSAFLYLRRLKIPCESRA
ncbi:hypothetical protein ANCCEY_14823 [Ancylostoma ceylanicum]|uniref:Phlebovirus glycoprotein G2 fusion domain-containing protein n=1 Tax=Ancylostoma ceylanicum TaxID=53326 RepID=A0A0D6L8V5_9BILA|nr:hypothetical protein ANCCEY_14823 [Ancylostoma ceylanicum]